MTDRLETIKRMSLAELQPFFSTLPQKVGFKLLPDLSEAEWAEIGKKCFYNDWLARVTEESQKITNR
jgi:hypothetical protein